MDYDYGKVQPVSDDVFEKAQNHMAARMADATVSDKDDVNRIERLLDLRKGVLEGRPFRLAKGNCDHCARLLTFYDFVYTAIVDAGHPKSFIVHTLLGSKRILNKARKIRCSSCNTISPLYYPYNCDYYGCASDP
jgi:hypothetical protein